MFNIPYISFLLKQVFVLREIPSIVYSYRKASMGLISAARYAGHNPNTRPTSIDIVNEINTALKLTTVFQLPMADITFAVMIPEIMPINPPIKVITMHSIKNCMIMSFLVAQIHLLMPISFVLWVTVASIMFIMPMPPTIRDIPAIADKIRLNIFFWFSI